MTQNNRILTEVGEKPQPGGRKGAKPSRLPGLRLALLAGLLLWLACPPVALWPLAWVALAPLILSVTRARSIGQAAWRGYLFGWVFLGPVWYWVGLTIVAWTHSPIGWVAWFALTLILAGFYALWGSMTWWLAQRTSGGWSLAGPAALWVVMEWARTLGSLNMPWAQLSYTQYRVPLVLQCADITGAYGVSFLIVVVNAAIALRWRERHNPESVRWIWLAGTLTLMICLYGLARLQQTDRGRPLTVAAMQGNFNSYHPKSPEADFQTFRTLTAEAKRSVPSPSLYVWGESAAPYSALADPYTYTFLSDMARDTGAGVLVGTTLEERVYPHRLPDGTTPDGGMERIRRANATVLFTPHGGHPARYDKQQLVPFGEFTPFGNILRPLFGQTFGLRDDDVEPGANSAVLRFDSPREGPVALGPFICYEAVFPDYARRMARAGATLLVTQSNDSWFRSHAAMEQHLAAVTLRAIENRRQVVRATTTGITCLVDAEGRVMQSAPTDQEAYVYGTVQRLDQQTLYTRLGDWFVLLCALLVPLAIQQNRLSQQKLSQQKSSQYKPLQQERTD